MNRLARMLRLPKSARYAMLGLVHLAGRHGAGLVLVETAARDLGLPPSFLAKLFQRLTRRGLLRSARGPGGGYALARPPEEISLADVAAAMQDAELERRPCLLEPRGCEGRGLCAIHDDVVEAERRIAAALARVSLAQAALMRPGGRHA